MPPRTAERRVEPRVDLYGLDRAQLADWLAAYGAPHFHAAQVFRWLYARQSTDPLAWSDLPRALREAIARDGVIEHARLERRAVADDGTVRYRACFADTAVECVYMRQSGRVTLCISSQVGCALDCDFCLTGKMGLRRQLVPGEILGQVAALRTAHDLADVPFNLVFMGMGEPLHNYAAVTAAIRLLADAEGFAIPARRITLSTVGLAPAIEKLAAEPVRPRLAISLNATTDQLRDRLMPVNRKYPLARLLEACRVFRARCGERVTFEYVLLDGVNDSDADVDRLGRIARAHGSRVNLIPFNAVPGRLAYRPPPRPRVLAIRDRLLGDDVKASVRWSRGADARAACGQLALLDEEARP